MTLPDPHLIALFQSVARGELTVQQAAERSQPAPAGGSDGDQFAEIDGATVDLGRKARCGFGEVIYGEGKPAKMIGAIAAKLLEQQEEVLVTRCDPAVASELRPDFVGCFYQSVARTLRLRRDLPTAEYCQSGITGQPTKGSVAVLCAGSTDLPVAREAAETLAWMGVEVQRYDDIGVAGPQRLQAAVPYLKTAQAVVVVAGLEGALPSVVGGHLAVPIVAVPTSVGYGASLGGWAALLGMLNSCASNVTVVNIDAGFKGGYVAGLIAANHWAGSQSADTY